MISLRGAGSRFLNLSPIMEVQKYQQHPEGFSVRHDHDAEVRRSVPSPARYSELDFNSTAAILENLSTIVVVLGIAAALTPPYQQHPEGFSDDVEVRQNVTVRPGTTARFQLYRCRPAIPGGFWVHRARTDNGPPLR